MNQLPEGTPVINLNSPNAVDELKSALGLSDGDVLEIMTPQFNRVDNLHVAIPDKDEKFFNNLKMLSAVQLKELGLQPWEETDKGCLWLFPFQWYDSIPEGFEVIVIDGKTEQFKHGVTDDDMRFGALAYGIIGVNNNYQKDDEVK